MQTIHFMLCAGMALAAFFFISDKAIEYEIPSDTFQLMGIALCVLGIIVGYYFFDTQVKKFDQKTHLKSKLATYQRAFITRAAFLEGPIFFCLFAINTSTHNIFVLILVGSTFALMLLMRPTKQKIVDRLKLSREEQSEFE